MRSASHFTFAHRERRPRHIVESLERDVFDRLAAIVGAARERRRQIRGKLEPDPLGLGLEAVAHGSSVMK